MVPGFESRSELNAICVRSGVPLQIVHCGSIMFFRVRDGNKAASLLFYLLREKGMTDVIVLVGGIIPEADIPALKKAGIAEIFLPGTSTQEIVDFIHKRVSHA